MNAKNAKAYLPDDLGEVTETHLLSVNGSFEDTRLVPVVVFCVLLASGQSMAIEAVGGLTSLASPRVEGSLNVVSVTSTTGTFIISIKDNVLPTTSHRHTGSRRKDRNWMISFCSFD
jgi:hypothetical protein